MSNPIGCSNLKPLSSTSQSNIKPLSSTSQNTSLESVDIFPHPSHRCEIHSHKNMNLICTFAHCSKKGLICNLCQHSDHFDHSEYCLPWEIFLENIEKYRAHDKSLILEVKKRLKSINNGTKKILKDFMMKTTDVCLALSKEVDKNVEYEISLMKGVIGSEKQMCNDFKDYDENLMNYKIKLKHHLDRIKVEIYPKKAEKISFSCPDNQETIENLHEVERSSQSFEDYLKEVLGEEEKRLAKMDAMVYFHRNGVKNVDSAGDMMQGLASTKETFVSKNASFLKYYIFFFQ